MKKLCIFFLFTVSVTSCRDFAEDTSATAENDAIATRAEDSGGKDYYWSGGRRIWLDADHSKMIVGFDSERDLKTFARNFYDVRQFTGNMIALVDVEDENVRQKISADKSAKNKISAHKVSGYDTPFYLTGEIIMKPKEGVSPEEIVAKFKVDAETVKKTDIGVIIRLKEWNTIIPVANSIYESGMVEWCHPDFITRTQKATVDPFFDYQYYLKNTGQGGGTAGIDINVEPAWEISKGAGIRVAVIDDGVEDHTDLAGRVADGYTPRNPYGSNSDGGNGRPRRSYDGHGQACAGIIAASHNTIYTAGVAPEVTIVPVNILWDNPDYHTSAQTNASAINWAWNPYGGNADVISNSWSFMEGVEADVITQAIHDAVTYGRYDGNSKGCIVVFAAGNSRAGNDVKYPASLSDPGSLSNFAHLNLSNPEALLNVIAVGAVDRNGYVWDYSCRGSALDVVAPSGDTYAPGGYFIPEGDLYTLDRMGANGYNSGDYVADFGGTSAACPQVAGIAALMLAANPELTGKEVVDIIESTANYLGSNLYTNPYRTNGEWNFGSGYGLVDAGAAVEAAVAASLAVPVITVDDDWVKVYDSFTASVTQPQAGVGYEWEMEVADGVSSTTSSESGILWTILTDHTYFEKTVTVKCRASVGNVVSAWSASLEVVVTPTGTNPVVSSTLLTPVISKYQPTTLREKKFFQHYYFTSVNNPQRGVTYEWEVGGTILSDKNWPYINLGRNNILFPTIPSSHRCRVWRGNEVSAWSNTIGGTTRPPVIVPDSLRGRDSLIGIIIRP